MGAKRAVASESIKGSFTFVISFRSNCTGFSVYTEILKIPSGCSRWEFVVIIGVMDYESCGDDCEGECTHLCYQYFNENNWKVVNSDKCKNIPLPDEETIEDLFTDAEYMLEK